MGSSFPDFRRTFLVTGAAGFIGANLTRFLVSKGYKVAAFDNLSRPAGYMPISDLPEEDVVFIRGDIRDAGAVYAALEDHGAAGIFHAAAAVPSGGSGGYIETNIVGTFSLLSAAMKYYAALGGRRKKAFRLVHVSTSEVYGGTDAADTSAARRYRPGSPYSASKASANHLIRAWAVTYGLPALSVNCPRVYGPWQQPCGFIPQAVQKLLRNEKLTVREDGGTRDWLYVKDCCAALCAALENGERGETYDAAGGCEKRDIDALRLICSVLGRRRPKEDGASYLEQVVCADGPRESCGTPRNLSEMKKIPDWEPAENFETGIEKTVEWHLGNPAWAYGRKSRRRLALDGYEAEAAEGDTDAMLNAGMTLAYGACGVERDPARGVEYLEKAAAFGNADAAYELGRIFTGSPGGGMLNMSDGLKYLNIAAENGRPEAMYRLGLCRETGSGLERDLQKAAGWYEKIFLTGTCDEAVKKKAMKRWEFLRRQKREA